MSVQEIVRNRNSKNPTAKENAFQKIDGILNAMIIHLVLTNNLF